MQKQSIYSASCYLFWLRRTQSPAYYLDGRRYDGLLRDWLYVLYNLASASNSRNLFTPVRSMNTHLGRVHVTFGVQEIKAIDTKAVYTILSLS